MYCGRCGNEIPDNAAFCPKCGNAVSGGSGGQKSGVPAEQKVPGKKNPAPVFVKAGAAVVVIAVIFLIGFPMLFGRSEEKVVKQYIEAVLTADGEKLYKLFPKVRQEAFVKQFSQEMGIDDEEGVIDYFSDDLDRQLEAFTSRYGSDWTYTFKTVEEMDFTEEEINARKDTYRKRGVRNLKIDAMKRVTVEVYVRSKDKSQEDTVKRVVDIAKIGRSWYFVGL